MHLRRVKISEFRNLKNFEINFSQTSDSTSIDTCNYKTHAVIGQNGSGKSNLIEAIITIFRDLDLYAQANLTYELDYEIRGYNIEVKAENGKRPSVYLDGKRSSAKELADNPNTYLPSHVFAYYSGKSGRLEQLFQPHVERFNKKMRSSGQEFIPSDLFNNFSGTEEDANAIKLHSKNISLRRKKLGEDLLRRLFYFRGGHTQLVLLACFLSKDPVFEKLLCNLNILELDSALFVLKQPHYLKSNLKEKDILDGDNRFWFAQSTVVSEFLDKLWEVAVAPIDDVEDKLIDFRGRREKQEQLYLFVPNKKKLRELGDLVGPPETFFRYAEGAYIGDLIDEVRITVKHKNINGHITFNQLSEGELQLLTVLGLMRITSQDHCLFLLDEPDTHLNPIWKLRYFDEIEKVIRPDENNTIVGNSQIIITTHDPMMIGGLQREQVRIMRNDKGSILVETPEEHPRGMGFAGLLKSELFGLRSTVDSETLRRLDRRNLLYARGEKRTSLEEKEMALLSEELSDLGFAKDFKDPYYAMFVKKMALHTKFHQETLTPKEQHEQDAIADSIIDEILAEEAKK